MKPLVFQSDFGRLDGAVSAMYGVANTICEDLRIYEVTHDIPEYDIWEASYRLLQTVPYWPEETVFVSVVDPGVGSKRKSVVVKTNNNQYIVTPDNGTLSHIKKNIGIKEARIIDEKINRRAGSNDSYTFHGRDVYAFTGAKLASGMISFEEVGPLYDVDNIVSLEIVDAFLNGNQIEGTIDVLDPKYGSIWTNIPRELFEQLDLKLHESCQVTITHANRKLYQHELMNGNSFSDVEIGEELVYINSLNCVAVAINQGNFSQTYGIHTGTDWKIIVKKC